MSIVIPGRAAPHSSGRVNDTPKGQLDLASGKR
jgi:hypothetical protein